MRAIQKVRKISAEVACHALGELIVSRLLPDVPAASNSRDGLQGWIEKACVTYAHFAASISVATYGQVIDRLGSVFDAVAKQSRTTFSPRATHAIQALIWKAMASAEHGNADALCSLLRHPLFESAGQVNKAMIGRKIMTMAMAAHDFHAAREAFFQMPSAAQNDNITRYLAFKLALRSNDYSFAIESLEVVARHADRDPTFLYACVLEAQQSQMGHLAVAALQAMLDKRPPGIHLPSLLRCTARLLIAQLDTQDRSTDEFAGEVVSVFENAASNLQALRKGSNEQWRAEIQWWSKNAYNLAIRLCDQIHPEYLIRLLSACSQFIDAYPEDAGPMHGDNTKRRKALSHFLAATSLIALGRSYEEGSEDGLQRYLRARREVAAFDSVYETTGDNVRNKDAQRRTFELRKFDLECILKLRQWEDVGSALQACLNLEEVDSWDALADVVLIIHRRTGVLRRDSEDNSPMMDLLNRIINETWRKHQNIVKAARWLRLSFTVDLNDGDGKFALKLLGQAAQMAKKGRDGKSDVFPETELMWIATTAFNKSVDLLALGVTEGCQPWIDGALELARFAADNGALHAGLTYKKELVVQRIKATET
ncbi:sporulation-specific protein 22 [Vermiconidia calcicola]|uniref:Sporulation-specific protein 22 n=1 Tax=Vermiconidia calcicola TaxID=1690605 RepID=A0ACC3MJH9_9PEZI|nr:sporulation-specific protein 22 [Vermiconidia calcicola]